MAEMRPCERAEQSQNGWDIDKAGYATDRQNESVEQTQFR